MDDPESSLNCKKNIKWIISRIEHFNSVVPYQIDTLAAHKVKIHQVIFLFLCLIFPYHAGMLSVGKVILICIAFNFQAYKLENFSVIRQERISAEKSIRNLKQLQIDIDSLREQVIESDRERFDKLVQPSCERIKTALTSFSGKFEINIIFVEIGNPLFFWH